MTMRTWLGAMVSVAMILPVAVIANGCGGSCPQVQCPVCEEPPPPPPPAEPQPEPEPPPVEGVEQWVHLPVRITFPTNRNELDDQQRALIREFVNTLQARRDVRRVRIEGHTDSIGRDAANEALSLERAQTVLNYLVQLGVPAAMLEAQGMGATQPITSDTREMDRAQNRRVEFSILVVVPHDQVVAPPQQ